VFPTMSHAAPVVAVSRTAAYIQHGMQPLSIRVELHGNEVMKLVGASDGFAAGRFCTRYLVWPGRRSMALILVGLAAVILAKPVESSPSCTAAPFACGLVHHRDPCGFWPSLAVARVLAARATYPWHRATYHVFQWVNVDLNYGNIRHSNSRRLRCTRADWEV